MTRKSPPSPSLPQPVVLLRNSERKTYRRCRQQWKWKYQDRMTPISTKGALAFGTLIHSALEQWYIPGVVRGRDPVETFCEEFDAAGVEFGQWNEDGERIEARELGIAMLENYLKTYGDDPHLEVISPEQNFEIPILSKQGRYMVTLVGRFDLVWRDLTNGRLYLTDHKTAKSIKVDHLELDDQAGGYLFAAQQVLRDRGLIKKKERIAGVMYNFMRKAKPDERPRNEHGHFLNKPTKDRLLARTRELGLIVPPKATVDVLMGLLRQSGEAPELLGEPSKNQPPPYFMRYPVTRSEYDHQTQLTRLRKEAYEMDLVRKGKLPIYKNPTKDCSWDCDFFDMCIQHETGADWEETAALTMTEWNPYDGHDETFEEE